MVMQKVSLNASEWQWGGYGYALPGGAILNPPSGVLEAFFNPAPTTNPNAEQYLGRPLPAPGFIVGHTYRARAVVKVTGARVRMTQGWITSSGFVDESPDDQVLEHVFLATREADWIGIGGVHVRMVDGSPSSVVVKSFELKDLDAAPPALVERVPLVLMPGAGYLDPWRIVVPMTISYGRSGLDSQAEAPSLSFKWLGELSIAWGDETHELEVGAPIEVDFNPRALASEWGDVWHDKWSESAPATYAASRRFTGRISELKPDRSGQVLQTTVTVIGKSVDAAHRFVGDKPWPEQTEQARVAAIAAAAGLTVDNRAGSWRILARDVDFQPSLDLLRDLPASTGALVYERRDGTLRYDGSAIRKAGGMTLPETALTAAGWSTPAGGTMLAGTWPDGSGARRATHRDRRARRSPHVPMESEARRRHALPSARSDRVEHHDGRSVAGLLHDPGRAGVPAQLRRAKQRSRRRLLLRVASGGAVSRLRSRRHRRSCRDGRLRVAPRLHHRGRARRRRRYRAALRAR
jgi:hypothetical protein